MASSSQLSHARTDFIPNVVDECQQKYGSALVWKACCNVFDYLNLAAVRVMPSSHSADLIIDFLLDRWWRDIMCAWWAISWYPDAWSNTCIVSSPRNPSWGSILWYDSIWLSNVFDLDVVVDLMWSDPDEVENWAISPRGAGWLFGGGVTREVRICTLWTRILWIHFFHTASV